MIVRISSIAIPKTKIAEYLEYAERSLLPAFEAASGLDSVHLLQRSLVAYDELIAISVWNSEEALVRFVESCPSHCAERELAAIEFEPHTYNLVASRRGRAS